MPATLPQIQARLEQALALRDDAGETVQSLALGGAGVDVATRTRHVAKLQGYHREVEVLQKVERDLISQGRAAESDLRILSGFDASRPETATETPAMDSNAQMAPREAPRNDASEVALPASGDVF